LQLVQYITTLDITYSQVYVVTPLVLIVASAIHLYWPSEW